MVGEVKTVKDFLDDKNLINLVSTEHLFEVIYRTFFGIAVVRRIKDDTLFMLGEACNYNREKVRILSISENLRDLEIYRTSLKDIISFTVDIDCLEKGELNDQPGYIKHIYNNLQL